MSTRNEFKVALATRETTRLSPTIGRGVKKETSAAGGGETDLCRQRRHRRDHRQPAFRPAVAETESGARRMDGAAEGQAEGQADGLDRANGDRRGASGRAVAIQAYRDRHGVFLRRGQRARRAGGSLLIRIHHVHFLSAGRSVRTGGDGVHEASIAGDLRACARSLRLFLLSDRPQSHLLHADGEVRE